MNEASRDDYGPITWIKRTPIYIATVIAALMVVTLFLRVVLESAHVNTSLLFAFRAETFLHGWVWQLFTYPWLEEPDFFFLISVAFFYFPAVEIEKYLGRRRFLILLGLLVLYPAVIVCLWKAIALIPDIQGNYEIVAALFIAFATLYPNIEYWGTIPLKWIAFACIFISSLRPFEYHDWRGLVILWGLCAVAFGYIRFLKSGADFQFVTAPFEKIFRRKPKFKVVPREVTPREEVHESIDPLLDKISKHGLSSLTAKEKAQLENARKSLLKKRE